MFCHFPCAAQRKFFRVGLLEGRPGDSAATTTTAIYVETRRATKEDAMHAIALICVAA